MRKPRGTIYLCHFDAPLRHARHYLGWVEGGPSEVDERQARHRSGRGAKILAACVAAGIGWRVVATWPDVTRDDERRVKGRHGSRLCPVCNPTRRGLALPAARATRRQPT